MELGCHLPTPSYCSCPRGGPLELHKPTQLGCPLMDQQSCKDAGDCTYAEGPSASLVPYQCSLIHRRSKSACDRRRDMPKLGAPARLGQECSRTKNIWDSTKPHETQCVLPRDSSSLASASPICHISRENDVNQLQFDLEQERSVHRMLDKAVGRTSSTLSPCHRHFSAQTRELIAEIELLEEEIANREQHVLSLYRSIFDQCMSGPPSVQCSSITSPVHTKSRSKKHRGLIPSVCSSKKLPLQPFPVSVSVRERARNSEFRTKIKHGSFSSTSSLDMHHSANNQTYSTKASSYESISRACTLKDHLYQCPCKISEEMVRCMASIYCLLRSNSSDKQVRVRSPFLSRSSTSVILPRRSNGDENLLSSRKLVEISSITVDKDKLHDVSCAITHYRSLVEQLENADLIALETNAKLAFWINMYNALIMHAYLAYGIPSSSLRRIAVFHKAAYNIGGHAVTASSIELSLLCCRSPRNGRQWLESILSTAMRRKFGGDGKLAQSNLGLPECEPLVLFALCTGASSDPALKVYTSKNVAAELDKAKKEYLQSQVVVKKSKKIFLPKIAERYAKEAGLTCDELLKWISKDIDTKLSELIQKCLDLNNKKKASQMIEWMPYNMRFQYSFARSLIEKPLGL